MKISVDQKNIHWQAANKLVEAVASKAEEMNLRVNVAVVDSGGHLAAFLRMPGSAFHSVDIAINKAYTAMSFGLATSQWGAVAENLSPLCKSGLLSQDRLMTCGGGVPIEVDGHRIGGIGVSGASEQQDEELATQALQVLQ
ncbi:MAG: hypothetical protein ACI9SC_002402 [Gammaproteobacteria bacterium]|jgi:uncharacterized protein GlcG (DUF336 family)